MILLSDDALVHVEMIAGIVIPLGSGIAWLIYKQGQRDMQIDTMWSWFTNDGHNITGYKPGDEHKRGKK